MRCVLLPLSLHFYSHTLHSFLRTISLHPGIPYATLFTSIILLYWWVLQQCIHYYLPHCTFVCIFKSRVHYEVYPVGGARCNKYLSTGQVGRWQKVGSKCKNRSTSAYRCDLITLTIWTRDRERYIYIYIFYIIPRNKQFYFKMQWNYLSPILCTRNSLFLIF